jgi:hypothetical protein
VEPVVPRRHGERDFQSVQKSMTWPETWFSHEIRVYDSEISWVHTSLSCCRLNHMEAW